LFSYNLDARTDKEIEQEKEIRKASTNSDDLKSSSISETGDQTSYQGISGITLFPIM